MKLVRLVALLCLMASGRCFGSVTSQSAKVGPITAVTLPVTVTVFPFQFSGDLLVLDLGQSGGYHDPALVLTLGSDYTVSGGGYNAANQMQMGSVVVVSGGANNVQTGDQIVVLRQVPLNQLTSLISQGSLTVPAIEQALDKQATITQQLQEEIGRSLRFENFEFIDGTLFLNQRVSANLGFNGSGTVQYNPVSGGGGVGGAGPRASGVFALNSSSAFVFTITYGTSLSPAPTQIVLTFNAPSGSNGNIILGNIRGAPGGSSFQISLAGPIGDTLHTVSWQAY